MTPIGARGEKPGDHHDSRWPLMSRALAPRRPGRPAALRRLAAIAALAVLATVTGPLGPAPAEATTFIFGAEADAHVVAANPNRNYGKAKTLQVDSSPLIESYLRFRVKGVDGAVRSAKLRLWVSGSTSDGPAVYPSGTAWSERTITWSNRPARTGGVSTISAPCRAAPGPSST